MGQRARWSAQADQGQLIGVARGFPLLAVVLIASACEGSVGISGVWTGVTGNTGFNLTLVETDRGAVTGAGRVVTAVQSIPANVAGAHAHPALTITITMPGTPFSPINYQGVLSGAGDAMRGVLYGSGFSGDSLRLVRNTPAVTEMIVAP
ncbi:MAG: hypothetical protein HY560_00960 [Gemmatimonadetes bacterium]|nr:hypothetical protein [Gemmatimonadota bacterium]